MKRTIFETTHEGQTARIRYCDDCGYYATIDGTILDDGTGISGYSTQAWERLNAYLAGDVFDFATDQPVLQ